MNNSIKLTARRIAAPVLGALGLHGCRERHVFADSAPNPQDTIDIFQRQWITAFPPELGFTHIRYGVIDINGPAGSAFFCLASRPGCD